MTQAKNVQLIKDLADAFKNVRDVESHLIRQAQNPDTYASATAMRISLKNVAAVLTRASVELEGAVPTPAPVPTTYNELKKAMNDLCDEMRDMGRALGDAQRRIENLEGGTSPRPAAEPELSKTCDGSGNCQECAGLDAEDEDDEHPDMPPEIKELLRAMKARGMQVQAIKM